MFKTVMAFAGLIALALVSGAAAQPKPSNASVKADALIGALVKAERFSGTVLVAKDGKPVYRKGFGLANREWNIPNTPSAKFRIGSNTKAFTATAILQLQEAGKLSVDDPISKYYPDAPAAWSGITLKHLLTHTSGIPSYTDLPHFIDRDGRLDRTPEEIIKLTSDMPLQFPPGSKFAYDNTGYILLGYVVEKVSGEKYADYVRTHIFQPLGMTATGYDSSDAVLANRAAGYDWRPGGFINTPYLSTTQPFAAGSIYSTADDMLTWARALDAGKPLGAASLAAMTTDYGHGYGFGWFIDKLSGHDRIGHSGGINGFLSKFDRYPRDGLTVVVLSNQSNAPVARMADELAAIYLAIPPRTAVAGGDAVVRRMIDELQRGAPDYDRMIPPFAEVTRKQLDRLQKGLLAFGAVKSVTLAGADISGSDRYRVVMEKATLEWSITFAPDGKVGGAYFGRVPDGS